MTSTSQSSNEPTERREVRVDDPDLSPGVNERLTGELRAVVGADAVTVPANRPHVSRGEGHPGSGLMALSGSGRLMLAIGASALIVIGGILTATTGSWWFVALAVVLDLVAIGVVISTVFRMVQENERPDPVTVVAMEEEGIASPERRFTALVAEFTPPEGDTPDSEHRDASTEADPLAAGRQHRKAATPTGGPSEAVGPGDSE